MSAEESAVPATPQQTTEPAAGIYDDIPDNRTISSDFAAEMDQRLGIPPDLRTGFSQENPTSEAEPAPVEEEQPQPEAEPEQPEEEKADASEKPETEGGEEDDEEPKQNEGEDTQVYKARRGEWRQRKRAQRAEAKATELEQRLANLEGQRPVTVQPTFQDALAHVETLDQLEAERLQFKTLRDYARRNPDGWIANEGTPQQQVISAEQARDTLSWAEDVLSEQFPRKEREIAKIRPSAIQQARQIMPEMLDAGSLDNGAALNLLREFPEVATNPKREVLLALALRGVQAIRQEQQAGSTKNGTNGKAKLEVPKKILEAAEQKAQLQRQTPPGRPVSNNGHARPNADLEKSGDSLARNGSAESLKADLRKLGPPPGIGRPQRSAPVPV